MPVCLDTYVIRDKGCVGKSCEGANLLDKLVIASTSGWPMVELWHSDVEAYTNKESVSELRKRLAELNLTVASYKYMDGWLTGINAKINNQIMKLASEIGAKTVVAKLLSADHKGHIPTFKEATNRYLELLKLGDELGVYPACEFVARAPAFNQFEDAIKLVRAANHPQAKVVVDLFHLWRSSCDKEFNKFAADMDRLNIKGSEIAVVHFTDARSDLSCDKQTDSDRRLPGVGSLNLHRAIEILRTVGYFGPISLNVYDQSLWDRPPAKVAVEGLYRTQEIVAGSFVSDLTDGNIWSGKQSERCMGLWSKQYSHLDPRLETNNRARLLRAILEPFISNKKVLDFKCGFSPLAELVSVGCDAFQGCIDYLSKMYPDKKWICMPDKEFSETFEEPIDVLMHIGLGDSDTEIESHLRIRAKCKPELIVIECCANDKGQVDDSKPGSSARWEKLKQGLTGDTHLIKTNMTKRPNRLLFIGK